MSYSIKAPNISRAMAEKAGVWNGLKIIGRTRSGKQIAVNQYEPRPRTSNVLLPGFLIPPDVMEREIGPGEVSAVIVKISPSDEADGQLAGEREILASLMDLPGVPRVLASGTLNITSEDEIMDELSISRTAPFFVMPLIAGGDLTESTLLWELGKPPTKEAVAFLAQQVFPQLAERLASLHERNVVHRDVKPNNVLFNRPAAALTLLDFGRANWLDAETPRIDMGTFGFHSPEMLLEKPGGEDPRNDTYGLGATCFTVLTGAAGVLYGEMLDVWRLTGLDFMAWGRDEYMRRYYQAIAGLRSESADSLLKLVNMPPELKETPLGKYLIRLFHPNRDQRPADLREVADTLRRLGGELDTIFI